MAHKLVNQLIFIHDNASSCSDCGAASEYEAKQVWFDVKDARRNRVQTAVKRMLKNWAKMMTVVLGPNPDSILRHLSVQLTPTTAAALAFQHGKVVLARPLIRHDYKWGLEIELCSGERQRADENLLSEKGSLFQATQAAKDELVKVGSKSESESSVLGWPFCAKADAQKFASGLELSPAVAVHESALGWPLRRISISKILQTSHMSKSETAMTAPERSESASSTSYYADGSSTESSDSSNNESSNEQYCSSPTEKLQEGMQRVLTTKSSDFKIFHYKELEMATSHFAPGNLVGVGGSSSVYKGRLPSGKLVAIKVFRFYTEACEDLLTEMEITSSVSHKHIVPLAGVCLDQNQLISVYELLPQGSLEEHLHGYKRKPGLPWEVRFRVAVAVAEALTHLHDECPRPVIHRDVKSSNILLSNDFQPQLSDFGLAMWGQKSEMNPTLTKDVFGTFGYIAPEYFMHGKVSDKIDVYSYGVVLLELLSGRRPVNLKAQKGQESLVHWAKHLIDNGDVSTLLDSKLGDKIDADQFLRMVLAAYLCTSQSAELRPKMSQIMKLLKGEFDFKQLIKSQQSHLNNSQGCGEEEEVWDSHLSHCVLKVVNDTLKPIRRKPRRRKSLADCLNECNQHFKLADLLKQDH